MTDLPPLIVVSLKMYLGVAATRAWVADVADVGARLETGTKIELAVLPTFPLLESTAKTLAGTGIRWGAQDVAASADGAQTGEVSAAVLAELGCRYVEIAHSERQRLFGEDGADVQAKAAQVVGAGLVPLYCVGEPIVVPFVSRPRPVSRSSRRCWRSPQGKRSSSRMSLCGRSTPARLRRRSMSRRSASTCECGSTRMPALPAFCMAAAPGRARTRASGPSSTDSSSGGSPTTPARWRGSSPKSSPAAKAAAHNSTSSKELS